MIDKKQLESRIRILKETCKTLHKLSKQSEPRGLSTTEKAELKSYNSWLITACKQLENLLKHGEKILKLKDRAGALEMQESFNLQYLQLQQDMQAQNRQFTMVSNIMKVKHDTANSVIRNMR
ncbi:hypothetical protein EU527_12970 [Candidatus Thorarchaeota archaeon]|nr:MAG: hypothetical protein EU527_12970 [Candidatus Thorarchaeota archaeon]